MKTPPAPAAAKRRPSDEDLPLIADIRLLGRILGDVIREQEGEESYALVEKIRKLSVAFRRDADHAARMMRRVAPRVTAGARLGGGRRARGAERDGAQRERGGSATTERPCPTTALW